MNIGSCRFGIWRVEVSYRNLVVYRIRFVRYASEGPVPLEIPEYLTGKRKNLHPLVSVVFLESDGQYAEIYRAVQQIPYGKTMTYGDIAQQCGTSPRVVGNAMARNPTPLLIPCHRVVAKKDIGGFSWDIGIKRELLALESRGV